MLGKPSMRQGNFGIPSMNTAASPASRAVAMAIGARLKRFRDDVMTQREMARRLGVSVGYLSDVENGKNKVNADIIVAISLHFPHVNTRWLLTGQGEMLLSERDEIRLDIDALDIALHLFFEQLETLNEEKEAARWWLNKQYAIQLYYQTYLSHRRALIAQGVSQEEARARAIAESRQLNNRSAREANETAADRHE
jgi:transcriptional regulator with XRE-family HTH domain